MVLPQPTINTTTATLTGVAIRIVSFHHRNPNWYVLPVHGSRTQRRKKRKFHFRKPDNELRKGNYSVFGLEEKELSFEIKLVKKWRNYPENYFRLKLGKLGRVYTSLPS